MKKEKPFDMELFFAALADRTRLRLINMMGDDEVCVCYFAEVMGTNSPKISRHLAYLKKAGLVSVRRDWKWSYYRLMGLADERANKVLEDVKAWLKEDPELRKDRLLLAEVCCAPAPSPAVKITRSLRDLPIKDISRKDAKAAKK